MFKFIVFISAIATAFVSGFFSVRGISLLFAGAVMETGVMAATLEVSKLVCTSFLYRYWNKIPTLLKCYLVSAVILLMGITSLGIYGFLTSAYQLSASTFGKYSSEVAILESQRVFYNRELESIQGRINSIIEARTLQEESINRAIVSSSEKNSKTSAVSARKIQENAMKMIDSGTEDLKRAQSKAEEVLHKISELDLKMLELKTHSEQSKDILTFKFVADAIGWKLEDVVKWFIFIIIIVFDPLAVGLILAYNLISVGSITKNENIVIKIDKNIISGNTHTDNGYENSLAVKTDIVQENTKKSEIINNNGIKVTPIETTEAYVDSHIEQNEEVKLETNTENIGSEPIPDTIKVYGETKGYTDKHRYSSSFDEIINQTDKYIDTIGDTGALNITDYIQTMSEDLREGMTDQELYNKIQKEIDDSRRNNVKNISLNINSNNEIL